MAGVKFGVYDWDNSAWVNGREETKRQAISSARKSSIWKRELPNIETLGYYGYAKTVFKEDRTIVPANLQGGAPLQTPLNGESKDILGSYRIEIFETSFFPDLDNPVATYYFYGDRPDFEHMGEFSVKDTNGDYVGEVKILAYHEELAAFSEDNKEYRGIKVRDPYGVVTSELSVGPSGVRTSQAYVVWDTTVVNKDSIGSMNYAYGHFPIGDLRPTVEATPESTARTTIAHIDLMEFLKAYQVENPIEDIDGNSVSFETQQSIIDRFLEFIATEPDDAKLYLYRTKFNRKARVEHVTIIGYVGSTSALKSYDSSAIMAQSYEYTVTDVVDGDVVTSNESLNINKIDDNFDISTYSEIYNDLPVILKLLSIELGIEGSLLDPDSLPQGKYMFTKAAIIHLLTTAKDKNNDIINTQIQEARKTSVGKVLYASGNLDGILDSDVEQMNEFYLSFHIANFDEINSLEDEDEATDRYMFQQMVDYLSTHDNPEKWREYFWAVIHPENLYVEGYLINWEKVKKLPPHMMMTIMTTCMRLEWGVPKPKRKVNWLAIVISVVITIVSWGTLWWVNALLIVSTALVIASEVSGNAKLAKYAEYVGYATIVGGALQAAKNGLMAVLSKLMLSPMQLALKAVTIGVNYGYQQDLENRMDKVNELREEVDGVKELIANERMEKFNRIQKFVHGDHIDFRYTNQYTDIYNKPYNNYA